MEALLPESKAEVLRAACRRDFQTFFESAFSLLESEYAPNWHVDLICDQLMRVKDGEISRLIINIPPRYLKSWIVNIAFTAWMMGHDPSIKIISVSYNNSLAKKHARMFRRLIDTGWFKWLFPKFEVSKRKNSEIEVETAEGGFRLSASLEATITGRGADYIIFDDPQSPDEVLSQVKREKAKEWYDAVASSRLNDKRNGHIIVISQRLHYDDLTQHLLDKGGFQHLTLPAIAQVDEAFELREGQVVGREIGEALHPSREPLEVLEKIKADMSEFHFIAQYQQLPVARDGNIFKKATFRRYRDESELPKFWRVMISLDTAFSEKASADFTAATVWGISDDRNCYLLEVVRQRLAFPALCALVRELSAVYRPTTILIEDHASGKSLDQQLRSEGHYPIKLIKPEGDKQERAHSQTAPIEGGRVFFPETASWLKDFEDEVMAFPKAPHDDQVDSMCQFLCYAGAYLYPRKLRIR